jgi:hypothetical protein
MGGATPAGGSSSSAIAFSCVGLPCVYVWHVNDEMLYVGRTDSCARKRLDPTLSPHHVIRLQRTFGTRTDSRSICAKKRSADGWSGTLL